MAGLPIQPAANLPPKATQKDAVSATTAVPHMAFLLAQSIAQGARLKIEAVGNGMLRVQAGPLDWRVGRTGTNEFRVWFEG